MRDKSHLLLRSIKILLLAMEMRNSLKPFSSQTVFFSELSQLSSVRNLYEVHLALRKINLSVREGCVRFRTCKIMIYLVFLLQLIGSSDKASRERTVVALHDNNNNNN